MRLVVAIGSIGNRDLPKIKPGILRFLTTGLTGQGHTVATAATGAAHQCNYAIMPPA
jgi:hypothetical protein